MLLSACFIPSLTLTFLIGISVWPPTISWMSALPNFVPAKGKPFGICTLPFTVPLAPMPRYRCFLPDFIPVPPKAPNPREDSKANTSRFLLGRLIVSSSEPTR